MPTADPRLADLVVARHRESAESALMTASGGRPLCRIEPGSALHESKYAEGGLAAVAELQRTLRGVPDDDVVGAAMSLLTRWAAERDAGAAQGASWIAYREGAVAALGRVVDDLAAPAER